jgi:hypothetical protein
LKAAETYAAIEGDALWLRYDVEYETPEDESCSALREP